MVIYLRNLMASKRSHRNKIQVWIVLELNSKNGKTSAKALLAELDCDKANIINKAGFGHGTLDSGDSVLDTSG